MINKDDIKVGLRFYITRNDCLKCNFDPICVHDNTPILFSIDRKDGITWFCSSVETDYRLTAYFSTESIMKFGKKYDILTAAKEGSENEKTEQVSHPSHYAWLKDLCGVEPLDICRCLDFNTGNAIKYLLRKDKADGNKTKTEKRIEDLRKAVFLYPRRDKIIGTWNRLITLARTASSLTTGCGSVKKNASGETFREMIMLAQISSIRK